MKKCTICGRDVASGVIVGPECVSELMEANKLKATARERLIVELFEIEDKSNRRARFMQYSNIFFRMKEIEQGLLIKQLCTMEEYSQILKKRLSIWEEKNATKLQSNTSGTLGINEN